MSRRRSTDVTPRRSPAPSRDRRASATKANVDSTPSFLVGPTGGTLSKIETRTLTIDDFRQPVKDALAEAKSNN